MNNWTISGNIGKDCEVRTTANNKVVCDFSVAVKSGRGDYEKANWVKCVILDKRAESKLVQYLTKGMKVFISGELSLDSWEKDGVTRSMLKLVVI
jgi:single-strand DNA-binding protein